MASTNSYSFLFILTRSYFSFLFILTRLFDRSGLFDGFDGIHLRQCESSIVFFTTILVDGQNYPLSRIDLSDE